MSQTTEPSVAHTPGPWHATENKADRFWAIVDDGGYPVVVAHLIRQPADANARLIAASPTLLSTAKALLDVLDSYGIRKVALEMRVPLYERAADLIDAIAKAEGREP